MNPSLGKNFEAMDPLEWLARLSGHIPDPGQHRTLFYGEYANRNRGARRCPESGVPDLLPETPRRRSSPSWARLVAKIYQVDLLVCSRCGQRMSVIAFLTDLVSIKRILDHLGLSTPPQERVTRVTGPRLPFPTAQTLSGGVLTGRTDTSRHSAGREAWARDSGRASQSASVRPPDCPAATRLCTRWKRREHAPKARSR